MNSFRITVGNLNVHKYEYCISVNFLTAFFDYKTQKVMIFAALSNFKKNNDPHLVN